MGRKVILMMTDIPEDGYAGLLRRPTGYTPNLDKLAADGIRFDSAYTTQPARAAIFTGSYPHSCAGWSNSMGLSDNVQNIGRRLTDHGVHSAYIGKGHLDGGDYFGLGRCADGWDPEYWYDMCNYMGELTTYTAAGAGVPEGEGEQKPGVPYQSRPHHLRYLRSGETENL